MSTAPKDQSGLLYGAKPAPERRPTHGEVLWTLRKPGGKMHAELRDNSAVGAGAELQLFHDNVFVHSRRYPSVEIAIAEAGGCRADFEKDGWAETT